MSLDALIDLQSQVVRHGEGYVILDVALCTCGVR